MISTKYIRMKRYDEEDEDEEEDEEEEEGGVTKKKIKKVVFFKIKVLVPMMIINEKTQLGRFVSVSKRF